MYFLLNYSLQSGFPSGSEGKASARNAGDPGSIPGSGRSPGEGKSTPVLLPGKSQGRRSLVGYGPWRHRVGHWATSLIVFRTWLGLRVILHMCSIFWVFISKIQMFQEAQRHTSPADSDRGEGRVDWTAACWSVEEDPGKVVDRGPQAFQHEPCTCLLGEAGTSRNYRMLSSRPGSSSPRGALFTARDKESPSPALKGTCLPSYPKRQGY